MIEKQFSIRETCTLLGLSRTTVWRMVKSGRLPAPRRISIKRVVFPASELEAYITGCTRSGAA